MFEPIVLSSDDDAPPAEKPTALAPPTDLRRVVNTRYGRPP